MTYPNPAARHLSSYATKVSPLGAPIPARRPRSPQRNYSIAWVGPRGHSSYETILAPAVPVIENSFANLVRGSVVTTQNGPVPVEDLEPGMMIATSDHGYLPLAWIGSYDLTPREAQNSERVRLFRVTADSFGLAKPGHDLMLGPASHILMRHAGCEKLFGIDMAYAPIRGFEDGQTVIATRPMSPVSVFNLAFDRQACFFANELEVESFHPAAFAETLLDLELREAIIRLFPQARSLDSFGPAKIDRLSQTELQTLRDGY